MRHVHLKNALRRIVEHTERIVQHGEIEAVILRCCKRSGVRRESVPGTHVDEVPRRGSAEQRKQFVAGQVVQRPHGADGHVDCRVRGRIEADVDLEWTLPWQGRSQRLGEPVIGLVEDVDLEACAEQAVADRRPEPIDGVARWSEAVEVTCRAIDHLVSDQGTASSQAKPSASASEKTSDATRCWSSDSDMHAVLSNPSVPRVVDGRRQPQRVPDGQQRWLMDQVRTSSSNPSRRTMRTRRAVRRESSKSKVELRA